MLGGYVELWPGGVFPPRGGGGRGTHILSTPGGKFPPRGGGGFKDGGLKRYPIQFSPQGWRRVHGKGRVVDVKAIRGCLGNGLVYDGCHCGRYMFVLKSLCHAFGSR